jgi:hypothetical protein
MDQASYAQVAYARLVTFSIRSRGHVVNVLEDLTEEQATQIVALSDSASRLAAAMTMTLTFYGDAAPVSWAEMEALSGFGDTMTGSSRKHAVEDIEAMLSSIDAVLSDALPIFLEHRELGELYRGYVPDFESMMEAVPWAA